MGRTDLYSTIFERKSIRSYDPDPLDDGTLKEIKAHLKTLEPLYGDIKTEFKILSKDLVKRRMMREAPQYLAVFSEVKDGYLSNVGFMLQQMDLFFSANSLGSCWQGIPTLKKEGLESSSLKFVILMPFGNTPEPVHRTSLSEFKRKSLPEITDIEGADDILEAARLAPSAGNGQPWFFTGDKNLIHAYALQPNFIRGLLTKKYPPIDTGISFYHLKLASEHFEREPKIVFHDPGKLNADKYHYVASLELK